MIHLLLAIIYLAFISLGLPDALLGSAWPSMYREFAVPVSYSGAVFMIIAVGTVISSLQSDRLTRRFGTGPVTAVSVMTTAAALLGFSVSGSYWELCLWAVPYGLGAGSVDASLNNYVALHYASRHMSWLHCMWGIGASVGPYVMGYALTGGYGWNLGYRSIGVFQVALAAALFASLPLWRRCAKRGGGLASDGVCEEGSSPAEQGSRAADTADEAADDSAALTFREVLRIPGAKELMIAFFSYSAVEQTANLWASSYLVLHHGLAAEEAASLAGLFFLGITGGRFASGFLTMRFCDTQMIRLGQLVIFAGVVSFFLPFGVASARAGLLLVGLGCAPIYPSIIHSTPANFGAGRSQAVIGMEMAFAYVGTCLMPPLFGLIASRVSASLFPAYLLLWLGVMAFMHERMLPKVRRRA